MDSGRAFIEALLPPQVRQDALARRPAVLLATSMVVGAALLVAFALSQALTGLFIPAFSSLAVALVLLVLLGWFRAGGSRHRVAYAFMGIAFAGHLVGAIGSGGILSFTLPSLALYPLFGFTLLGRKGGLVWTSLVAFTLVALFGLHGMEVGLPFVVDRSAVPGQVLGNLLVLVVYVYTLVQWQFTTNRLQRDELEKARREAVLASQAKSRFLANVSHELRTPMNGVIGLAELTLTRKRLDETDAASLSTVLRSSQVMVRLLNDLLDLSRAESGVVTLEYIPLHPSCLIDEIEEVFAEHARPRAALRGFDSRRGGPECGLWPWRPGATGTGHHEPDGQRDPVHVRGTGLGPRSP